MAVALVQVLFVGQSKTSAASIAITGSKTITLGNTMFVGWAGDLGGTAFGCTDNLGNSYAVVHAVTNSNGVETRLFKATVTAAGTLTTQTVAWTTNLTAKVAESAEYSGVGEVTAVGGTTGVSSAIGCSSHRTVPTGGIVIGMAGHEQDTIPTASGSGGDPGLTNSLVGTGINTTGAGAASNIGGALVHALGLSTEPCAGKSLVASGVTDNAGAGAHYFPEASPSESTAVDANVDVTNDAGIGSVAWATPSRGGSENNSYAIATLTLGQTSNYLKYLNFLFALPASVVILGHEVIVECKQALVLTQSLSVRLVKAGTVVGDTKTVEVPQTEAKLTFGSPTDLWGTTWLDTDIESTTFGLVAWLAAAEADTYSIDNAYIKVYWGATAKGPFGMDTMPMYQTRRAIAYH
jgi:hypothetical protein